MALTDSADPVPATGAFAYTCQVNNTTAVDGTTISAAITLDSSLTYVSSSGTGWSIAVAGQVVTCTLATLAGNTNANAITINVTAGSSAVTASSSVAVTCASASTVNATQTTAVHLSTVTVTLADSADPVLSSAAYSYTCSINNTGDVSLLSPQAVLTLSAGVAYVSSSGTGWTIGVSGQVVTCTRTSLTTGVAPTITVNVTAPTTGPQTVNCASAVTAADLTGTDSKTQSTTVNPNCTQDATSGIYCPSSAAEWQALGLTAPSSLWLCQEASGNAADTIGSVTLTASGSPTYQQTITGWSRKGFGATQVANQKFSAAAGAGPNPSSTSCMMLVYFEATSTPAGIREVFTIANTSTTEMSCRINSTPLMRVTCKNVTANGVSNPTSTGLQPGVLVYDRTNSTATLFTGQEKISGTFSASVTDSAKGFFAASSGTSFLGHIAFGAEWSGASAELTSTQVKAILTTLGWSISWS